MVIVPEFALDGLRETEPGLWPALTYFIGVHGSEVQGSILVPRLHLCRVFTRNASISSSLIQNLEPNWQLFREISIFNEDF